MDLKETELCLGLPGDQTMMMMKLSGKRGFSETVDLKLNLQSSINNNNNNDDINNNDKNNNGSVDDDDDDDESGGGVDLVKEKMMKMNSSSSKADHHHHHHQKMISTLLHHQLPPNCSKPPAPKAQVVGWPPVRSYRKNVMVVQKSNTDHQEAETGGSGGGGPTAVAVAFVKVCMDGAPYLRKVDLKMYKSYQELSDALAKMFSSFTMGNYGTQGMIDFMNESKLMDLLNSSEYVPTYEDKDGDWMLVGDVPWEMFVDSCKRLRIMKGSEAIGLAPRAMEKCKNRC